MATPTFCCGCECGIAASSLNGTAHWSQVDGSFSTSTVRSGARSLRANLSASNAAHRNAGAAVLSGTLVVVRCYLYFASVPNTNWPVFMVQTAAGDFFGVVYQSSDGKLYAGRDNSGTLTVGASGITPLTNTWLKIDLRVDVTNNPNLIDVQVNGTALGQASIAIAASTVTNVSQGRTYSGVLTTTVDYFLDDLIASATSGDYPLGPGYVNHFTPISDGTHNVAGTGDFAHGTAGADILNSTTDAWDLVNDVPLPSSITTTNLINIVAPPNATDYVECIFGSASGIRTPVSPPRAVEVILAMHQAGTGAGNMEVRLNDNGTTSVIYTATGVAGVTSLAYKRAHFATPPTGGSWNAKSSGAGAFNNLRFRFGSPAAVDANPDQYLDAIMIEAEFPDELDHSMYDRPFGIIGRSQFSQLLAT